MVTTPREDSRDHPTAEIIALGFNMDSPLIF